MVKPTAFKEQVYSDLKKNALDNKVLFIDPEFRPEKSSIGKKVDYKTIQWKRPKDLCDNPRFVIDERNICHDIRQGELGNCWMVAACSCLAVNRALWDQVVPDFKEQDWTSTEPNTGYAGIFHFCFWKYGNMTEVVVDDLLPTKKGKLVFVNNGKKNEFWCALLEKAYAKLWGSYEMLEGGELSEALEDFSGGITEQYNLKEQGFRDTLAKMDGMFAILQSEMTDLSLMAAAIPAATKADAGKPTNAGLYTGHAYSVTAIRKIQLPSQKTGIRGWMGGDRLNMIRLRNPWGEAEWRGAYSPRSDEWRTLSEKDRVGIGLVFDEPGEFWMKFDDFLTIFVHLSVCRVINDSYFSFSKRWYPWRFEGSWRLPDRAGGCVNNLTTFLNNPQYAFSTLDGDDLMLEMTQITNDNAAKNVIGFTVMKVEDNREYRLHQPQTVVASSPFKNSRSVFLKLEKTAKGRYVMIPTLFEKDVEGRFLLRFFLTSSSQPVRLEADLPSELAFSCLPGRGYAQIVTRITIVKGIFLRRVGGSHVINPYVLVRCEGDKCQSRTIKNSTDPVFDFSCLFFRRYPTKPITVDVMHSGMISDEFVGRLFIHESGPVSERDAELMLSGKKLTDKIPETGSLLVHTSTNFNLRFF